MSESNTPPSGRPSENAPVREHDFDGIQEFDNPMPNWWLVILFSSIVYAFVYWGVLHRYTEETDPGKALITRMERATQEAAKAAGVLSDPILWSMSRDDAVVKAGREVYLASCAQCHLPDLAGAIGPNLKDKNWIHGEHPMEILKVITEGFAIKGMPTWGPVLGRQKISEVVAFILSFHQPPPESTP